MNAIILKPAAIDQILQGKRTWELRGLPTKNRGAIALIKGGAARIVGTCQLVDCVGPLTIEQLQANLDKHQLPLESLSQPPFPKTYAWVLSEPKPLAEPITINNCRGGTWVRLTPQNVPNRLSELEPQPTQLPPELPKVETTVCCAAEQPQPQEVKI